ALHDGQVLDDGAVIRDIILHYDEFGPYGHELPVLLADDGSVRAAVQVWDAASSELEDSIVLEAGEGPVSLLRTVPSDIDGLAIERPYAISDVRGTSDGSLSIVGPMRRGPDAPIRFAVWSAAPEGEVRLEVQAAEFALPDGLMPLLSAD